MGLKPRSTVYGVDDPSWRLSRDGKGTERTITLDVSAFTPSTHYPDGYFPSGLALGKIKASGLYGPYSPNTTEIQTVTVTGTPTGGSFTLTYAGQTTSAIAYNATAAAVQAALVALSNVNDGDVVVTGGPGPGTPFSVKFAGQFLGTDVAAMSATPSLTGGSTPSVTIATPTAGGAAPTLDGLDTLDGLLAEAVYDVLADEDRTAALMWRGVVGNGLLPIPVDVAGKADVAGRIRFE